MYFFQIFVIFHERLYFHSYVALPRGFPTQGYTVGQFPEQTVMYLSSEPFCNLQVFGVHVDELAFLQLDHVLLFILFRGTGFLTQSITVVPPT